LIIIRHAVKSDVLVVQLDLNVERFPTASIDLVLIITLVKEQSDFHEGVLGTVSGIDKSLKRNIIERFIVKRITDRIDDRGLACPISTICVNVFTLNQGATKITEINSSG
jgi:hypothetical protein